MPEGLDVHAVTPTVQKRPGPNHGKRLDPESLKIYGFVEQGLTEATTLLRWWQDARKENRLNTSPAVRGFQFDNQNSMFMGEAPLDRGLLPVIGLEQDFFFDRPKATKSQQHTDAQWFRKQVREFALRYFMRIATTREFLMDIRTGDAPESQAEDGLRGWGYYQLFYKSAETGEILEFPPEDRFSIIDLREIGPTYDWVVFKVRFFDFTFRRPLLDSNGPRIDVPVSLDTFVVIDSNFVIDREDPKPGVIGEYGFGTPVVPVPDPDSILAYGPGQLSTAFQFITFQVMASGEVRVKTLIVANRPTRLLNFRPLISSLNLADFLTRGFASPVLSRVRDLLARANLPAIPLLFTFADVANTLTGGLAGYQFCISREQLYREVMATHFLSLESLIHRSLAAWNSVADWLDPAEIPQWVHESPLSPDPIAPSVL